MYWEFRCVIGNDKTGICKRHNSPTHWKKYCEYWNIEVSTP
jgi:hypothetical protein